jgi:hypothetical protein
MVTFGGPFGTVSGLFFEKKKLIPALQQLVIGHAHPLDLEAPSIYYLAVQTTELASQLRAFVLPFLWLLSYLFCWPFLFRYARMTSGEKAMVHAEGHVTVPPSVVLRGLLSRQKVPRPHEGASFYATECEPSGGIYVGREWHSCQGARKRWFSGSRRRSLCIYREARSDPVGL